MERLRRIRRLRCGRVEDDAGGGRVDEATVASVTRFGDV